MRAALWLWTLPGMVLGALLALACIPGGAPRATAGVLELPVRRLPGGATAITFGFLILYRADLWGSVQHLQVRRHELVHVRQWARLGPFFLLAYGLASLVAWGLGGHVYDDNAMERRARQEAGL